MPAGTQITLVCSAFVVPLNHCLHTRTGHRFADPIGLLKHEGPPVAAEGPCKPDDDAADWESLVGQSR